MGLVGVKYRVTPGISVLKDLAELVPPPDDENGNATLLISSGDIGVKTVGITSADLVTNIPADPSFTLSINRSTGVFSGTFTRPDGTRPSFKGIVIQQGLGDWPTGFWMTPTPVVKDFTGFSGKLELRNQ